MSLSGIFTNGWNHLNQESNLMYCRSVVLIISMVFLLSGCQPIAYVEDKEGVASCRLYRIETWNLKRYGLCYVVFGDLTIKNDLSKPLELFLPNITLVINEKNRGELYINSIAASSWGFSPVIIEPESKEIYSVYWAFDHPINKDSMNCSLEVNYDLPENLDIEDMKKNKISSPPPPYKIPEYNN